MNYQQNSKRPNQESEPGTEQELDLLLEQSVHAKAALLKILHHVEKKQQGKEPANIMVEFRKKSIHISQE